MARKTKAKAVDVGTLVPLHKAADIELVQEHLRAELEEIESLEASRKELREIIEAECPELQAKLADISVQLKELSNRREQVLAQIYEAIPELLQDDKLLEAKIQTKMDAVKGYIKELDPESFSTGLKVQGQYWELRMNRTPYEVVYSPNLLEEYPEMREWQLEGEPAVLEVPNTSLLDRMIAIGQAPADLLEHRMVHWTKSPSVTVKPRSS